MKGMAGIQRHDLADVASAQIAVKPVDDTLRAAWDAYVSSHAKGTFYHLYDWKRINEHGLHHECEYLAALRSDGLIQGILPLVFIRSRIFGRILCSMPFMNFGGPITSTSGAMQAL